MRVGSGPKTKKAEERWLGGNAGRRAPKAKPALAPLPVLEPPQGMTEAQIAVWQDLAPKAAAARTLTVETAPGFALLCKQIVLERMMFSELEKDGLTDTKVSLQMDESGGGVQAVEKKAHALLSQHRAMMQRVEAGLLRYRLSAMGKELLPIEDAKDEWSEFDGDDARSTH